MEYSVSGLSKNAEPIPPRWKYKLCVYASGFKSVRYSVFPLHAETRKVFLHFGQNSGKFFRIVSCRICVLVFPWHAGHSTQFMLASPVILRTCFGHFHHQHHCRKILSQHIRDTLIGKVAHPCGAQGADTKCVDPGMLKQGFGILCV